MSECPINVFFDASSLIKVGEPPGKDTFWRLVDLVDYGFITVVTTDLTKYEIARHHTDNAYSTLSPLSKASFRQLAAKYFEIELPNMSESEIRDRIRQEMDDGVEEMFRSLRATRLDIDQVSPSTIFEYYDQNEGMFVAKNKKNQFPDAFIFERLKDFASADRRLYIVADDLDFEEAANSEEHLTFVKSIQGLFNALGLVQDEPDPDLESFLHDELQGNWDFLDFVERDDWVFDEYKITSTCGDIEVDHITAFMQIDDKAPLLVSADVTIKLSTKVEYEDGITDHDSGDGEVSFYASVVVDVSGAPKVLADVRVFDYSLDLGPVAIWMAN